MALLIVGCGYLGSLVARQVIASGTQCYALTRGTQRTAEISSMGIRPIVGHWLDWDQLSQVALPQCDSILIAVPHGEDLGLGDHTHVRGLENLSKALDLANARLVYISTTGLFSDSDNNIVNEQTAPAPQRQAGKIAWLAEQWLANQPWSANRVSLRLAGIYGPSRIPHYETMRNGHPLAVPQLGFLNLIHADDAANAVCCAFSRQTPRHQYVLSDGQPVERLEFYQYLASLFGLHEPVFETPDPGSSRFLRSSASKRIDPQRFFADFQFQPAFPSYREGLADCLKRLSHSATG